MISRNSMILAEEKHYSLDVSKTRLNNNVLVVGATGTGKTTGIVEPNVRQASGSYIVVDPKGKLHEKHKKYLEEKGYAVRKLNFCQPADPESSHYNFFRYIKSEQDIIKIAHMIVYSNLNLSSSHIDLFWYDMSEMLLIAVIGYLLNHTNERSQNWQSVLKLLVSCDLSEGDYGERSALDQLFDEVAEYDPDDFSVRMYRGFQSGAGRTRKGVLITLFSIVGKYDSEELRRLLSDDTIRLGDIGAEKTAVFVVVSDSDRSMDFLVNIFLSQLLNELYSAADKRKQGKLPVDTRLLLDDFATNVVIADFPRSISSMRSRGISVMLFVQSEAQLYTSYGLGGRTIIGNCDTYVYLGGNDIDTASSVAERAGVTMKEVLDMPVGKCWIFRRGEPAYFGNVIRP